MALTMPLFAGVVTFKPGDFAGQGTSSSGSAVSTTKNGVTVACDKAYGASTALRCYRNSVLTISSESRISTIDFSFEAANYNGGLDASVTIDGLTWSQTLTAQGRFTEIKVTIAADVEEENVDTISVTEALARLKEGEKGECYIKGKVSQILSSGVETYGNISYWLRDIDNPSDSIQAYRMKGADNKPYTSVMDIEFAVDDEILIYALSLEIYHSSTTNTDTPEATNGYYVRSISGKPIQKLVDWKDGNATRSLDSWKLLIAKFDDGVAVNFIRMEFISDKDNSIAGHHYLERGSCSFISFNGSDQAITSGFVQLTFKEEVKYDLFTTYVYTTQVYAITADKVYTIAGDIEFYAQDENENEIDLDGDRPFVPTEGQEITCEQARSYALSLPSGATSDITVTVHGFVTDLFSNGITFWMADQQGTEKVIQAYSSVLPVGVVLQNGTEVKVKGKVTNYNGTPEISKGNIEIIESGIEIVPVEVTVAEAIAACQALARNATSTETYAITGFIASIERDYSEQYGNISFWMSDVAGEDVQDFRAYNVKCDAELAAKLFPGTKVIVTDKLRHYYQDAKPANDDQPEKPERTIYETIGGGYVELASSSNTTPSDAVLAKYYEHGQVCVCIYVPAEIACYDIVLTGSFNGWSDNVAKCAKFKAVDGYDGWYVTAFIPEAEPDATKGIQAKPIILDFDGNFNWSYQVGAVTIIRGGVQVVDGYVGEIDLINYGTDAPNVYTVDAWKQNPCLYTFTISCNEKYGKVYGTNGIYELGTELTISAEAYYGYHFVKWSDGNTDNPRTIILKQDMNLTAIFAPNTYTFNVSCDEKYGKVVADNGEYDYLTELSISAKANYGYHFAKWSDGNTSNPRTISLTKNMDLTAIFAPNIYTISDNSNQAQGYIAGAGRHEYLTEVTLVATPKYGYHFTQWSDGKKEGSRKVTVTQDSTFTALFAPNKYTFSASCDEKYGKVVADNGEYDYLSQLTITANANYGYHFVKWSDGNTSNPRVITLTKDTVLTASFAPDTYTISDNSDKSQGYIANAGAHTYLSEVLLEATPNYGYHFVKWSDGKTNNPRTIIVTQDITLAAEFDIAKYGTCGDDNALTWTFDDKNVLTISGNGALNSNYTFGLEAPESMQKVVIESGVSSVGNGAFKNKTTLNEIAISHGVNTIKAEAFAGCSEVTALTLGANLQSIGANAFNGCKRIDEITVYAERVIDITETTFANIGNKKYVYVYVPEASLRKYQRDDYWSEFDLRVIGATTTTVAEDEVNVEPTTNTADVTWPAVDNAATYELTIKDKNGNVICTLIFNAQGQLTSIAFAAPGRSQYVAQVAGFTFTVTGLDSGSSYNFTMEAKDSQGEVLDKKEGSFTTAESGIATAIDNASIELMPVKVIRDNQLFILRDGITYTVQGQVVR